MGAYWAHDAGMFLSKSVSVSNSRSTRDAQPQTQRCRMMWYCLALHPIRAIVIGVLFLWDYYIKQLVRVSRSEAPSWTKSSQSPP